ncbi:MAG: hypothetical protein IT203_03360 [Fimbriimonadaceae bacterium]|nr:hypothetical protein [Fimbriimonadaceae bacterium]
MKSVALLIVGLLLAGCAKFPGSGATGNNTRVKITMTVAGVIKPNYIYVVAVRWAKANPPFDQNRGPIPVIASPWGNGIVAGRANIMMRWDAFQSPNYQLFRFTDPIPDNQFPTDGVAYLTQNVPIGIPLDYTDLVANGKTLEFTLDMSQIAPSTAEIPQIRSLQINFLTMDRVPQGNDNGSKFWDALGNGSSPSEIDNFLTIPVDRNGSYSNASNPDNFTEPQGDVPDPDLDIVNWTVQVIRP